MNDLDFDPSRRIHDRPSLRPDPRHSPCFRTATRAWTTQDPSVTCPKGYWFGTGGASGTGTKNYALAPVSGKCVANGIETADNTIAISNGDARVSVDYCSTKMAGFSCSSNGNDCCESTSDECSGSACSATYIGVAASNGHCFCVTSSGDCTETSELAQDDHHLFEVKARGAPASWVCGPRMHVARRSLPFHPLVFQTTVLFVCTINLGALESFNIGICSALSNSLTLAPTAITLPDPH